MHQDGQLKETMEKFNYSLKHRPKLKHVCDSDDKCVAHQNQQLAVVSE